MFDKKQQDIHVLADWVSSKTNIDDVDYDEYLASMQTESDQTLDFFQFWNTLPGDITH